MGLSWGGAAYLLKCNVTGACNQPIVTNGCCRHPIQPTLGRLRSAEGDGGFAAFAEIEEGGGAFGTEGFRGRRAVSWVGLL